MGGVCEPWPSDTFVQGALMGGLKSVKHSEKQQLLVHPEAPLIMRCAFVVKVNTLKWES